MKHLLDNIFWHALVGPHAKYATGANDARRYAPGFSPIVAFPDAARPNFDALVPYCESGARFYCDGWSGAAPAGWQIESESIMLKMVCETAIPEIDSASDAISLGSEQAAHALELAILTRPGPFGLRTIELGEYFGYFEGQRLVAMAGERAHAATLREISGVCTHPEFQGRGLAQRLVAKLMRRQMQRRQTPVLHLMRDNVTAHRLYQRMGFSDYKESVVRVISRS